MQGGSYVLYLLRELQQYDRFFKSKHMNKIFSSIIIATVLLLTTLASSAQTATATGAVQKATIKVGNLHCNNDMPTIKKQLLNQDGVEDVVFTAIAGESSVFTVTYLGDVTSQEKIEKTIEATPGCDDKSETPYKVKRDGSGKKKKS